MGQREDLETLRVGLLAAFKRAPAPVKAQIAGQLRAVVKDLAALGDPAAKEASKADELASRRKNRQANAADSAPPARRAQPRRRGGDNRAG